MRVLTLFECRFGLNTPTAVVDSNEEFEDKEDLELENEGEVVLVEKTHDDGTVEKIVFASGVEVDVYELEILCDKVIRLRNENQSVIYRCFGFILMLLNDPLGWLAEETAVEGGSSSQEQLHGGFFAFT